MQNTGNAVVVIASVIKGGSELLTGAYMGFDMCLVPIVCSSPASRTIASVDFPSQTNLFPLLLSSQTKCTKSQNYLTALLAILNKFSLLNRISSCEELDFRPFNIFFFFFGFVRPFNLQLLAISPITTVLFSCFSLFLFDFSSLLSALLSSSADF